MLADQQILDPDSFEMNVLVQPPRHTRPGAVLNPPVVVRVDSSGTVATASAARVDRLFGVLSVTSEDGCTTLSPPRTDLVRGNVADSVQVLEMNGQVAGCGGGSRQEMGFMAFPNVAIRVPGRYRLRVSLMAFNAHGTSSGSRGPIQTVLSEVVIVDNGASSPSPGMLLGPTLGIS